MRVFYVNGENLYTVKHVLPSSGTYCFYCCVVKGRILSFRLVISYVSFVLSSIVITSLGEGAAVLVICLCVQVLWPDVLLMFILVPEKACDLLLSQWHSDENCAWLSIVTWKPFFGQDLRPGNIQIVLLSCRELLEAWDFAYRFTDI